MIQPSMRLNYEPSSEPLHISVSRRLDADALERPPGWEEVVLLEVEIESIQKMLARAADTGHSNQGSTSFWMCKVRCWRWLFSNELTSSLRAGDWIQTRSSDPRGGLAWEQVVFTHRYVPLFSGFRAPVFSGFRASVFSGYPLERPTERPRVGGGCLPAPVFAYSQNMSSCTDILRIQGRAVQV